MEDYMSRTNTAVLVRKYRLKSGQSQAEVSKVFKYGGPQFISNWERGVSFPPDAVLKRLCKAIRLPTYRISAALIRDRREELYQALK